MVSSQNCSDVPEMLGVCPVLAPGAVVFVRIDTVRYLYPIHLFCVKWDVKLYSLITYSWACGCVQAFELGSA